MNRYKYTNNYSKPVMFKPIMPGQIWRQVPGSPLFVEVIRKSIKPDDVRGLDDFEWWECILHDTTNGGRWTKSGVYGCNQLYGEFKCD